MYRLPCGNVLNRVRCKQCRSVHRLCARHVQLSRCYKLLGFAVHSGHNRNVPGNKCDGRRVQYRLTLPAGFLRHARQRLRQLQFLQRGHLLNQLWQLFMQPVSARN